MIAALVAGLAAGYGVALPVGAIATYLVGLAARERFRVAAAAALGVATTDGLYAIVAAAGGVGLQRLLQPIATPLSYLAAAVLVALAVRTVGTAVRRYRGYSSLNRDHAMVLTSARAYLTLFTLTALNPSTIVYFAALVLGRQAAGTSLSVVTAGWFAVGALLASASWQLFLAGSGALLGRVVTSARGQLTVATLSGMIMLALAASLFVS